MKKSLFLVLVVMLAGCASYTGIRPEEGKIRYVSVFVVYDDTFKPDKIQQVIDQTSTWWTEQFGIGLYTVGYAQMPKHDRVTDEKSYVAYLTEARKTIGDKQSDIVVTFYQKAWYEWLLTNTIAGWNGVTEECYARHLTLVDYDQWVLSHELGHVFAYNHGHDLVGIMAAVQPMIPFFPYYLRAHYVPSKTKADIMAGKWRDFNQQVNIDDACDAWK